MFLLLHRRLDVISTADSCDNFAECRLPWNGQSLSGSWVDLRIKVVPEARVREAALRIFQKGQPALDLRAPCHSAELQWIYKIPDCDPNFVLRMRTEKANPVSWAGVRNISNIEAAIRLGWPKIKGALRDGARLLHYLRSVARLWSRGGLREVKRKFKELAERQDGAFQYSGWVDLYDVLTNSDREAIQSRIERLRYKPRISVLMPTYNVAESWLRKSIESVRKQLYPYWELCIADDCSTEPHIRRVLEEYARLDSRIKVTFRHRNGHISAASNSALELVTGEFVALLDHDDEFSDHALYLAAEELNEHPDANIIFSDEDKLDKHGNRVLPYFKSDWDPELFYAQNMMTHFIMYRTAVVRDVGGFREGFEGSQDYDLALRAIENVPPQSIRHIPFILYHWRMIDGSVALAEKEKDYAHEAARRALREHFARRGVNAEVTKGFACYHRVAYPISEPAPLVSIVIPTRDRVDLVRPLVNDLLGCTDYPHIEVLLLDNQSSDPETLGFFVEAARDSRVRVIPYPKPFNYSAINNHGVSLAKGTIVALLNNDLRVISSEWLREMVSNALRSEIGIVGAKLLYPDDRIQHAGVVLGIGGVAGHVGKFLPKSCSITGGHPQLQRSFSVVTGACMVMRREVFESVGGLDESLAVAFNDVDLCLRVREKGYRNIWLPQAELYHLESASRGYEDTPEKLRIFHAAWDLMRQRWGQKLEKDPYYNPNLTLEHEDMSLAFPPRVRKPWLQA